jgi:hypothetical protein
MSSNITTIPSKIPAHLEKVFKELIPEKARLIFVLDATASRQETWDKAAGLTAQMFKAAAAAGGLEMQLVYFRGERECTASKWVSDPAELSRIMSKIMCRTGYTQIERALKAVGKEHQHQKVAAAIVISDSLEEEPNRVYAAARELSVPVFMFQEGDDAEIASVYAKVASITKGAACQFDGGSAARLADLLKAVAAFASGGIKALSGQNTAAARLLLSKLK